MSTTIIHLRDLRPLQEELRHDKAPVVSKDEWTAARRQLLAEEKAFTKQRDRLAAARRELPWEKVDKTYVFMAPLAKCHLPTSSMAAVNSSSTISCWTGLGVCAPVVLTWLITSTAQLSIWPSADVTLVVVARAPLSKLDAYKKRMGCDFHGSRPTATASTTTFTSRSALTNSPGVTFTTIII